MLARTDTPVDRGVYVNMEGFYLQEGHAKPVEGMTVAKPAEQANGTPAPLPREQREVTAILVETVSLPGLPAELTAMALKTQINEGRDGQAAEPIREISVLLGLFVRPLELLLLLVTTLVVIVSAIGILVSMVGSSLERSRDVAVMRALGASRGQVLATVLIEAVILALGGGLAGWAARPRARGRDRPADHHQRGCLGHAPLGGPDRRTAARAVPDRAGDPRRPDAGPRRLPHRRREVAGVRPSQQADRP